MRPDARRERLLLEEVGDELVIYDLQRHRAHQLNRTAALVWQRCDGQKTVAELTKTLAERDWIRRSMKPSLGRRSSSWERPICCGNLLPRRAGTARMTRRQALRKLGKTAALALLVPAVTSILRRRRSVPRTLTSSVTRPPAASLCGSMQGTSQGLSNEPRPSVNFTYCGPGQPAMFRLYAEEMHKSVTTPGVGGGG